MDESRFRQRLRENGYSGPWFKEYAPHADGDMHAHDFSVMLLVIEGEFTLVEEGRSTSYGPGNSLELVAGVRHVERAGPEGALVLMAKK